MTEPRTVEWTYELPPAGDGASGLEDYAVEDARGDHVGKVGTVLRRGDELFLALEHDTPPVGSDLLAYER